MAPAKIYSSDVPNVRMDSSIQALRHDTKNRSSITYDFSNFPTGGGAGSATMNHHPFVIFLFLQDP